jgi:hypothetical protein
MNCGFVFLEIESKINCRCFFNIEKIIIFANFLKPPGR